MSLVRRIPKVADEILAAYNEPGKVDAEVKELIAYWHGQLNNFQIETPSDEFNNMVNVWNAYQCLSHYLVKSCIIHLLRSEKRLWL